MTNDERYQPPYKPSPIMRTNGSMGQRVVGMTEDGIECSVPHIPYERWIDPAGNIQNLCISTNRDVRFRDEKYGAYIKGQVRAQKWMPYDAPEGEDPERWAALRAQEIEKRRQKNEAQQERFAAAFMTKGEKLLKDQSLTIDKLLNSVTGKRKKDEP